MKILSRWYIAIALFFSLILDSILSKYLQGMLFQKNFGGCCWITVIGIILIALIDDQNKNNIWLTLVVGIIADCMYLGFIGAYMIAFPLLCFLIQKLARYLPEIFWPRFIVCICGYFWMMAYLFIIFNIIGIIRLSFMSLIKSIIPSVLVCIIFTLIFYKFWVFLAGKYPFLSSNNKY